MTTIKLASFNGEWMNDWFEPDSGPVAFRKKFTRDGQTGDVATTAGRSAALIRAIDADILAVQEAPSRAEEMQLFVKEYLSSDGKPIYEVLHSDSGGAQKLSLLYKKSTINSALKTPSSQLSMLLESWLSDVDGDGFLNEYQFTRQPLVIDLKAGEHDLKVIVLHTKSNFVNNGEKLWKDPATRQMYVIEALKSRRRNSAECMRVRVYVDSLLDTVPNARIVILGDLNDGPGRDYFEEFYLTHSVTDIFIGSAFEPERIFKHAQHDLSKDKRYTAIFNDFVPEPKPNTHLLLDHILLSPGLSLGNGLRVVPGSGTICHEKYEAQLKNKGKKREDRPSDHQPVLVKLRY